MNKLSKIQMVNCSGGKDRMGEFQKGLCEGAGFALTVLSFADLGPAKLIRLGMAATGLAQYIAC